MVINTFAVCALRDNYIWVMQCDDSTIVVDPGESGDCLAFLKSRQLSPTHIFITHHHHDHTGGLGGIAAAYPDALIYGPELAFMPQGYHVVRDTNTEILTVDFTWQVLHTPGHTLDHLCFYSDSGPGYLFCGDTLFSGGCGRLLEGDCAMLYHSLQRINSLPATTVIYPAHEYTLDNLAFAKMLEPENKELAHYHKDVVNARSDNQPSLPTSLALERKINPFLRVHEPQLAARVAALTAVNTTDPVAVFAAMRQLKDRF